VEWWREGGGVITEPDVRAVLNGIIDPCSSAAGCPAGLDEMGLLRSVQIDQTEAGAAVHVVIGVTEYGCLMGAPFAAEAYKRLEALPGIAVVAVELDQAFDWDRDDMRSDYQQRLRTYRAQRRLLEVPVVVTRTRPSAVGSSSTS
jgi:metal-sulfur cluster biosynthetic enzyme